MVLSVSILIKTRKQISGILDGADVPFIILSGENNRKQFVWEVYVDGMVGGEIMDNTPSTKVFELY